MYAIFPLRHSWESQHMNGATSHLNTKAIDCGVLLPYNDTILYAPFDGTVVFVDKASKGAIVAFQSDTKVKYADGTYDYMTVLTGHDNKPPKKGAKFKQGEVYSHMGTAGGVDKHTHLEVQKGLFKMATKVTSQKSYAFENTIEPNKALYMTKDTIFKYSNLEWKIVPDVEITNPVERNESVNQIRVIVDNLRARTGHSTNSQAIGFVQNKGIYNDLETYVDGTYTWHRIDEDQWIADNGEWLEILSVTDYKKLYESSLDTVESLNKQISTLNDIINSLKDKLKQINELSK